MRISQHELERRLNSCKNLANCVPIPIHSDHKTDVTVPIDLQGMVTSELSQKNPAEISLEISQDIPTQESIEIKSTKRSYTPGISKDQRVLAGILASSGETSTKVAAELGMTRNQVFHAARTTQSKVATPRDATLGRVQELALEKTMQALALMTPDKFLNADLKELSSVAANMSRVIEKTSVHESETRVQLVVYAPETKSEKSYKVLDV